MFHNLPLDLKAETLLGYIPRDKRRIELKGSHKRNAYEDITYLTDDEAGVFTIALARNGIYDILPESLFHPIDRFDNIPANEYKEKIREECEQQQIEEENARKYFHPIDNFLMELSTFVSESKNDDAYNAVLESIICDRFPRRYINNRFIQKAKAYMPICRNIRGNKGLFSLMLRHILFDENITISERNEFTSIKDLNPRYHYRLNGSDYDGKHLYLGCEFDEEITVFNIQFWKEEECNDSFLNFIEEMKVFEDFLNEYFIGLESRLRFVISTNSLPVRLSDEVFLTFLDYNTNI